MALHILLYIFVKDKSVIVLIYLSIYLSSNDVKPLLGTYT